MPNEESSNREATEVSVAEVDEHWTGRIGCEVQCANCGAGRLGKYCLECGQKHLEDRLKFSSLVQELVARLSNLERGLLHTFLAMMRHPGKVAREYVAGRQRPYVNPLSYFFLGAAAQILSFWSVQAVFRDQLIEQFEKSGVDNQNPESIQRVEELLGMPMAEALAESYISAIQQAYAYAALLFFAFPLALSLYVLHRLLGEKFRLGETTVFALFTFAQMLIITAICTPITVRLNSTVHMLMAMGTYILFPLHAHSGFFQRTWRSRLMTLIATVLSMIPFVTSIVVIFLVSFMARILLSRMAN